MKRKFLCYNLIKSKKGKNMSLLSVLTKFATLFNRQTWARTPLQLKKLTNIFNQPLSEYNIEISDWINHQELTIRIYHK